MITKSWLKKFSGKDEAGSAIKELTFGQVNDSFLKLVRRLEEKIDKHD